MVKRTSVVRVVFIVATLSCVVALVAAQSARQIPVSINASSNASSRGPQNPGSAMTSAAREFLDSMYLDPAGLAQIQPRNWWQNPSQPKPSLQERAKALEYVILPVPLDSPRRFKWDFFPPGFRPREGQPLDRMTVEQKELAHRLLKASLSDEGYFRVEAIRRLEEILRQSEEILRHSLHARRKKPDQKHPALQTWRIGRDPEAYYLAFVGVPDSKGRWGFRFEGHHLSLHWTIDNGKVISSTPQFFGASPSEVQIAGERAAILGGEEDIARALIKSISQDESKKEKALISSEENPFNPLDIYTLNATDALERLRRALKERNEEGKGITYGELNAGQKKMLINLIQEYTKAQEKWVANDRISEIRKAGLDGIRFAWFGSQERGRLHYYRIQGPTFLIEYDTFVDPNHQHTVWRDFQGDWAGDHLIGSAQRQSQANTGDYGPDLLMHHIMTADHHKADRARYAAHLKRLRQNKDHTHSSHRHAPGKHDHADHAASHGQHDVKDRD